MTTGPAHWDLLQKARAVDSQCFVSCVSPARDKSPDAGYIAYGHSSLYNPWGELVVGTNEDSDVIFGDINVQEAYTMRENIPCWKQKRTDVYTSVEEV